MKVTATSTGSLATGRLVRRIREELLSSRTVERLQRELEDELDAVSSSEHRAGDDGRRDALERAVRRIWGATL
jgi:NTP pyrophosphatase (non-canonical NTP hydrolase)